MNSRNARKLLVKLIIHVTISPILPGLERLDHRMFGGVIMLCRVPVRRRVTAADVAALFAQAKVDPAGADLKTVFAAVGAGLNVADRTNVLTVLHMSIIHPV
jgi:hypothetical protein